MALQWTSSLLENQGFVLSTMDTVPDTHQPWQSILSKVLAFLLPCTTTAHVLANQMQIREIVCFLIKDLGNSKEELMIPPCSIVTLR